tara:strand:- start:112 stop:507 length:396 start_codon:yes stop_codon:yes gene_type:complete
MEITKILSYLLIGLISGVFLGTIGIGAGLFTIPILVLTGLTPRKATLTALIIQLLPQTIPGVLTYYKENLISKKIINISLLILIGSLFGVYAGAYLVVNKYLSRRFLYRLLIITLFISTLFISYEYWNYEE